MVGSLAIKGNHARACGTTDHNGWLKDAGLRRLVRIARQLDDLAGFKRHLSTGFAHVSDGPDRLDVVASFHWRQELDRIVGPKKAFITVVVNQKFGGYIPEKLEHMRPIDQISGVVRLFHSNANPNHDFHTDLKKTSSLRLTTNKKGASIHT